MVQEELIDLRDETTKFCVSQIAIGIVQAGVQELLPSWNRHCIPGQFIHSVHSLEGNHWQEGSVWNQLWGDIKLPQETIGLFSIS